MGVFFSFLKKKVPYKKLQKLKITENNRIFNSIINVLAKSEKVII